MPDLEPRGEAAVGGAAAEEPSSPRMTLKGMAVAAPPPESAPAPAPQRDSGTAQQEPIARISEGSDPAANLAPQPVHAPPVPTSGPVPNPAVVAIPDPRAAEPSGPRGTARIPTPAAPAQPVVAPVAAMGGRPRHAVRAPTGDGAVGAGNIRVVCRSCRRPVWGWKLPFGVSCPLGAHHAHVSWFLVGTVASFWAVFGVVLISLVAIALG